jgi:hypothetical protein
VLIYSERSTAGWFVVREKYCCLVADKPREHAVTLVLECLRYDHTPVDLSSIRRWSGLWSWLKKTCRHSRGLWSWLKKLADIVGVQEVF